MAGEALLLVQMVAVAIAVGIAGQLLAHWLRLPSIVFLLVLGVLVGPDVLGWIDTAAFGAGLQAIVAVAVALILFEGGLQLHIVDLAAVGRTVRNLVTIGAAVTVAGATVLAHVVVGFPWPLALLFGAIVSVTGPTVINPILDRVRVTRRVDTLLRGEGILVDPLGAILAVGVLELLLTSEASIWTGLGEFLFRMLVGVGMGLAGGWTLGRVLRPGRIPRDLSNLLVLAWVLALFAASQALARESGLAAVVIAGMAVRRESIPQQHRLRRFKGELSVLFISILFILLAAHLPLATLEAVGWRGIAAVLALMWIVRPLAVAAATWRTDLSWRERLFVMWVCPRGVVAISIASFVALLLQGETGEPVGAGLGAAEGEGLLALVFLTIAITVVVQGTTSPMIARLLGLSADEGRYAVVVGAEHLGRRLAELLQKGGWEVLLLDSNAASCAAAQRVGLNALRGNSLDRETLDAAQLESACAFVATTANSEINILAARLAGEEYRVPRVYPVLGEAVEGAHEGLVEEIGGALAFGKRIGVEGWNDDLEDGRARAVHFTIGVRPPEGTLGELGLPDDVLPMVSMRDGRPWPCHAGIRWQPGDTVVALVRGRGEEAMASIAGARAEVPA